MKNEILAAFDVLSYILSRIYLFLAQLAPSKVTLRGVLYWTIAYLSVIVQAYEPEMDHHATVLMHLSATLAGLTVLRAFVDQSIAEQDTKKYS